MTLDNMTGITEGSYTGFCKSQLITCNFVKACNGVCPFEDALKHADKDKIIHDALLVDAGQEWIPCSERLPEDIRPVLVTWKNTDPDPYYQYIVGKHFIGAAHYCKGKWYWYSSVTEDLLAEYGKCESEEFDEAIEAVAWMPLPKPYDCGTKMKEGAE